MRISRIQFRLKSLLLMFAVVGLLLGVLIVPAIRQWQAVSIIENHGGCVYYDYQVTKESRNTLSFSHDGRGGYRRFVGSAFHRVEFVGIRWAAIGPDDRKALEILGDVRLIVVLDEEITVDDVQSLEAAFPRSEIDFVPLRESVKRHRR